MTPRDLSNIFSKIPERSKFDLVREALQAREDHTKFMTFFREDAVFTMVGNIFDYAFSGIYRGHANIVELLRRIDREIEMSDHKILNLVIDGDKIGLRRSVLVRHRGTSASRRLTLGDFVVLRDEKIAEIHEYVDTSWLKKILNEQE